MSIVGLVLLIFWGIARSFVTSSLRHESAAEVEGMLAEALAESAAAEAEARIGWEVNALELPLAELFRRQVLARESGEVDLTGMLDLPRTKALLATPAYKGYSLDDATARVVYQKQIDSVPTEKNALVVFTATVSSPGLVRRASRRFELGRRAKTTLTTVPRPFGMYGLFLMEGSALTDASAVNRCRERALEITRNVRQGLGNFVSAGGPAAEPLRKLLEESFDPDGPAPAPGPLALPDGAAVYGLAESREPQTLGQLDLAAEMREQLAKAERAQSELAGVAASGADAAALEASARAALSAAIAPLRELWSFQRNYAALAPDAGQAYADLAANAYKLRDDYFRRRAHYLLVDGPGRDLDGELKELLARPVQGVIALANATRPVRITGDCEGRVIVVAGPGGAHLASVNASETCTGTMTVVCSAGTLRVSGENTASVMLVDTPDGAGSCQLVMDAGARLSGSLIATRWPAGSFRTGEIERDDRTFSGFTDPAGVENGLADRFFVGLSPRVAFRRMVRP